MGRLWPEWVEAYMSRAWLRIPRNRNLQGLLGSGESASRQLGLRAEPWCAVRQFPREQTRKPQFPVIGMLREWK